MVRGARTVSRPHTRLPSTRRLGPPIRHASNRANLAVLQRQVAPEPPGDRDSPEMTRTCRPSQIGMIRRHAAHARRWVSETVRMLGNYFGRRASRREVFMIRGAYLENFDTSAARELSRHRGRPAAIARFIRRNRRTWDRNLRHVRSQLERIHGGLARARRYHCPRIFCAANELMHVRSTYEWIPDLTGGPDIRGKRIPANVTAACPEWFDCNNFFVRVAALIHEVGHADLLWADHAYTWQRPYYSMGWDDANANPDSYAVFARQAFHHGRHGPTVDFCT